MKYYPLSAQNALTAMVLMLITLVTGCAEIVQAPARDSDVPIKLIRTEVRNGDIIGTVDQAGDVITVKADYACNIRSDRRVRRTTKIESEIKNPARDYEILGLGLAVAGTGVGVLVDSSNVYSNDKSSRTYNSTGPTKARAIGAGLSITGAALLLIPLVDLIRASDATVSTTVVDERGQIIKDGVRCANAPAGFATVAIRYKGQTSNIGTTNARGEFEGSLDETLDRGSLFWISKATSVEVLVDDKVAGTASIKSFLALREKREWANLKIERCKNPSFATDCDEVVRFISTFPKSTHFDEAQSVLNEGQKKIVAIEDQRVWKEVDLATCTRGKASTVAEAETLCNSVEVYANRFPAGKHVDEAKRAVEQGKRRAAEMQARLDREAKEAELKEAQAERRKCEAECRFGCSSWQFRDNRAECFSACVASRCAQ